MSRVLRTVFAIVLGYVVMGVLITGGLTGPLWFDLRLKSKRTPQAAVR